MSFVSRPAPVHAATGTFLSASLALRVEELLRRVQSFLRHEPLHCLQRHAISR